MKFQSFITGMMHARRHAARAAAVVFALASTSCFFALAAKKHTYSADSSAVVVNGASVKMQVRPEGTEPGTISVNVMVAGAAKATFDGPFSWRLEAVGKEGVQRSLVVHRIRTRTGVTKRDEWYPAEHLGWRADFKKTGRAGELRAIYQIPGLLKVKPRDDGALTVDVDLTVFTDKSAVRKTARFTMKPAEGRRDEFVFIPAEIVENIGKPLDEQETHGWD